MTSTKDIQVPWLLAPEWKDFSMTKGLGHHRVPVGIILAGDEELITSSASQELGSLQVRLLNTDSATEARFVLDKPQVLSSLNTPALSVPFVDGQYLDKVPAESLTLNVQYPSNSKLLPIFRYDDDEDAFFKLWDSEEAEFAYIESDYFGMLIPEVDKEHARALPNGKSLKDVITYFDEIFTIYSRLIGLSFEGLGTDKNVRNRFFLKADKSGPSKNYANYGLEWVAENTASVKKFWLDPSTTNWGTLHEIAHGHELKNISDESIRTIEVWNNILVVFYQEIMMGDESYTRKGGINRLESNFQGQIIDAVPVLKWGTFAKLNFLMHMFVAASGQKSFIRFNQLIRQELAGKLFYASGCNTLEKLMLLFSTDFGTDVYPFMKLANAVISDDKLLEHYYRFSEVAYPLNYLISDEKLLNTTKTKLRFYTTSLVTPLNLRVTNLKGDFTLEIDKSIFRSLFGETLKLMDGTRTILERKIVDQKILFKNIPIGVYKVFIPSNTKNYKFIYDDFYAVVHANTPKTLTLSAKTMSASSLLNVKILFLGVGLEKVASLSLDFIKHVVKFNVFSVESHDSYQNKKYASVKIKNSKNEVILNVTLEGKGNPLKVYETPLQDALQIEIFHAETKNFLKTEDPLMDVIINPESNTNVLSVSKIGFPGKEASQTSLAKSFLKQIDDAANRIRNTPFLFKRPYCSPKYNLFLAIKAFKKLFKDHALSSKLEDKYKDCLHSDFSIDFADDLVDQI